MKYSTVKYFINGEFFPFQHEYPDVTSPFDGALLPRAPLSGKSSIEFGSSVFGCNTSVVARGSRAIIARCIGKRTRAAYATPKNGRTSNFGRKRRK